jgi:hypothetical protein
MEHLSSNTKAIAADKKIMLEQAEEQEVLNESSIVPKNERFRFESRPVVEDAQPVQRVVQMANPALTEIFKRLLNK